MVRVLLGSINCSVVGIVWELFCGLECFVGIVGSCKFRLVPIRAADIVLTALSGRALSLTVFKREWCFLHYVLCTCISTCTVYIVKLFSIEWRHERDNLCVLMNAVP